MIDSQRLLKMARKWQKFAVNARRRISAPISGRSVEAESCIKSVADKGHFVVYTIDGRRFAVPLDHLNSPIFVELLRMSEDKFGLPCDGPITIPCDAIFMEYVISFFERKLSKEVGTSLLTSMATGRCSGLGAINSTTRTESPANTSPLLLRNCILHYNICGLSALLVCLITQSISLKTEEQFGLACDGPIRVPCDAVFKEFVVYFIKRRLSKDVEKSLPTSIASGRCSTPSMLQQGQTHEQIPINGF
ncbi:hypothetical protein AAC387_Pa04g1944 [Persea americana]